MVLVVILYALFAGSFTLGKALVTYINPLLLVGIRMSIAGILLLSYQHFFPHTHFKLRTRDIWIYAQIALFAVFIPYTTRMWALQSMTSMKACLLNSTGPFISYILEMLFFRERPSIQKTLGLVIGFTGLMIVLMDGTSAITHATNFCHWLSWPEIAMIVSVTSISYGWITVRHALVKRRYEPAMVNGISMSLGGFLALAAAFLIKTPMVIAQPVKALSILAAIIMIGNVVCHNLYAYLLKRHSATMLASAGFLGPLFASVYGYFLFGETLSIRFFIALAIIFSGIYLFYLGELSQKRERFKALPDDIVETS
jgi:probable blue pigment (indigoidine) exporter